MRVLNLLLYPLQLDWNRNFELHYNDGSVAQLHLVDEGSSVKFISEDGGLVACPKSLVIRDWRATFQGHMGLGRHTLWHQQRKDMNVTLTTCPKVLERF